MKQGAPSRPPLAFQDVRVWVRLGKGRKRLVVDGAGAIVGGGGFLAVLGPSGAGKTSLLSAIAGEADAEYAGAFERPHGAIGFAPQDDCLLPFLTCGETMRFAAALRLARGSAFCDRAARDGRADAVLATLGLGAVASSRVGSPERRGVSGGERKRLALGVELVAEPSILVADEPTSGLDSTAALAVAQVLRDVGATVVASVHQPGARVYGTFSALLVLGADGKPVFSGPASGAAAAVGILIGRAVPPLTSAAEFLLDAAADPAARAALFGDPPVPYCGGPRSGGSPPAAVPRARGSRFAPLLARAWLNNARSPLSTIAAVGRAVVMASLVGALYSGSRKSRGQAAVSDRTGALFFVLINQAFSAMSGLRVFVDERRVFSHERRRGAYGTSEYFLAKSLAELPLQAAVALFFASLAYILVGLRPEMYAFLIFSAHVVAATLTSESLVMAVGAAAPDAKTAVILCPVILSTSLLFGGLFVRLDSLPSFLKPLQYLSLFRYAFAGLLKNEFDRADAVFDCDPADRADLAAKIIAAGAPKRLLKSLTRTLPCPTPDGATHVLRTLGAAGADRAEDLAYLLALLVAFRGLALCALHARVYASDRPAARAATAAAAPKRD